MKVNNINQPKVWLRIVLVSLSVVALSVIILGNPEAVSAVGNTYYVSPGGNDSRGDGSVGNPWQTVQTYNSITVSFQVDVTGIITDGDQLINTVIADSTQGITASIPANSVTVSGSQSVYVPAISKLSLWLDGTHLRGANVWQRVVVPNLDGDEFLGSGHVGPPYTQADFDRLATLGANYVNISHPGLFTEMPPYVLDEQVQANLDHLLEMIAQANMFAVITFRTGPGRSDFTFYRDGAGDWFDDSLLIESVWHDQAAQDAWAEMWRYTAQRYRNNPIVVGYDLMCEPNAAGALLDVYEPDEFYPDYANTLYDWNRFYPRLVEAIRAADPDTPILVSGMGWGAVRWLPALVPSDDDRMVYMVHQYEPQDQYTHQEPPVVNTYPGKFDLDGDDVTDSFDRDWLDNYLFAIDEFKAEHNVPVAVNEFGLMRWTPDGAAFMDDQMALLEQRGMNHALWAWDPAWEPYTGDVNAFNFRFGPDPNNHADAPNELLDVMTRYWARNTIRPSNFGSHPGIAAPAVTYETGPGPGGGLRLTDPPPGVSDQNPAFSPDGTHLIFTRFENGYNEGPSAIYRLNLATGDISLLTAAPDSDSVNLPGASWNGATGRIVFASDREDTDEIWTMAADGGNLARVTRHTEASYFIEPSFSPDGQWIVFEADPDAPDEQQQGSLWKMRATGSRLIQLTDGFDDRQPNWSPNGERILFQRRMPGSDDWNLYTIAADGSDLQSVTTSLADDTDASWSPESRRVVYSSDFGDLPTSSIFTIPVNGGDPTRITRDDTRYDGAPSWSPDGQWIAFESHPGDEDAPAAIWLIPAGKDIAPPRTAMADVDRWFYMIDVNLEPEMVEQIAASEYDMIVLDFIPSEAENTDYPMAEVIDQLHNAAQPKLVIAYIDTGQVEDYRTYWRPGWRIGNPAWIVGNDPDGWEGNFPVAYWADEWRDIWLGEDGYLQVILDAGFDGVYLDWVEAYSDENVIAAAQADEVDPRQEMIEWVGDMADFNRIQNPEFIVIAQNAAELAEDDDYLEIIDAIAQEQVWFDGGADNDPPGDCPLPHTDADVDTATYRKSLSPACRAQYDKFPDSTLHVSSEEYLQALTLARDKGKIIFTVDYAIEPDNVAWVYETSRALGFVPFVSNRALNQYVEMPK